jgi:hypothetical protein
MKVTVPVHVAPGDEVTIVADGVTNTSSTAGTLKVTTTSDPKADTITYTLR